MTDNMIKDAALKSAVLKHGSEFTYGELHRKGFIEGVEWCSSWRALPEYPSHDMEQVIVFYVNGRQDIVRYDATHKIFYEEYSEKTYDVTAYITHWMPAFDNPAK
jgi:hypothetical protein